MEVIPAIDIRHGKCVRLYQGDYSRETVYSDDPVSTALQWKAHGARRLHVVDLDGAVAGVPVNAQVIRRIMAATGLPVQLGGGIRTMDTIAKVLSLGVQRVILGTVAIENPSLVEIACGRFGEAIIVGVDAKDGYISIKGWTQSSSLTASELVRNMAKLGARRFIYTDVSRDGTLTEPNFEAVAEFLSHTNLPIIAAGGIASVDHLRRLAKLGVEGAIVGRALYTGDINLAEAFDAFCSDDTG